jgi:hypothetical protein
VQSFSGDKFIDMEKTMAKTSFRKSRSILSFVFSAFMIMVSFQGITPVTAQTILDDDH